MVNIENFICDICFYTFGVWRIILRNVPDIFGVRNLILVVFATYVMSGGSFHDVCMTCLILGVPLHCMCSTSVTHRGSRYDMCEEYMMSGGIQFPGLCFT